MQFENLKYSSWRCLHKCSHRNSFPKSSTSIFFRKKLFRILSNCRHQSRCPTTLHALKKIKNPVLTFLIHVYSSHNAIFYILIPRCCQCYFWNFNTSNQECCASNPYCYRLFTLDMHFWAAKAYNSTSFSTLPSPS